MFILYLLYIILYVTLSKSQDIFVKDTGIGFIHEDDIAIIFYVTLDNNADKDFEVSVCMSQCCDSLNTEEMDCSSMSLIGGDMGVLPAKATRNVTLIYPNLYLMNRKGQCTVNIRYKHMGLIRQKMARIEYSTVVMIEESCEYGSIDVDVKDNCRPVDCVVKYSGTKNFFDSNRMLCTCVTKCVSPPEHCVPDIGYSISANNCTNLNSTIGKDDLHLLDNNRSEINDCVNCLLNNVVCHHGSSENDKSCECDPGWVTTTDDEVYSPTLLSYHMCNVEVGAWNCLNKGKIRTTTILIAIFAITIASKILILMCILNWCYKRYRNKKDQVCTDKADSDREELIMCEEYITFDKCVCVEPPRKLETQTVNVSYYPCLPSLLSSQHESVGSKCKCSLNSDESIMLSKTTSSNRQVSFESDTDVTEQGYEEGEGVYEEDEEYSAANDALSGQLDGEDKTDVEDEEEEETEDTGNYAYVSRRDSSSSKTRSRSTALKSKTSSTK